MADPGYNGNDWHDVTRIDSFTKELYAAQVDNEPIWLLSSTRHRAHIWSAFVNNFNPSHGMIPVKSRNVSFGGFGG